MSVFYSERIQNGCLTALTRGVLESVAKAPTYLGKLRLSQKQSDLAISAYDDLIQLFHTSETDDLLEMVST